MDGQESEPTDKKNPLGFTIYCLLSEASLAPSRKNEGRRNGWEEKSGGGIDGSARGFMLKVLSEAPPAGVTETPWKPLPGPVNLPRKHTGGHYKVVLIG